MCVLSLNCVYILGESDYSRNQEKLMSKRTNNILKIQAFGRGEICILKPYEDLRRKKSVASTGEFNNLLRIRA